MIYNHLQKSQNGEAEVVIVVDPVYVVSPEHVFVYGTCYSPRCPLRSHSLVCIKKKYLFINSLISSLQARDDIYRL